ncbi:hypothetical protein [Azohydromonas australica]|uniref:hypothetical protein n=1 Tax=Azohydromonas australica TaxID=364039 RepID=UPI0003FC67CB|nr:hypothetical protein [Azohydromonas australica]
MRTNLLAAALLAAVALSGCDTRITQPKTPGTASAPPITAAPKAEPVTGFKGCRKFFPGELPRVPDL